MRDHVLEHGDHARAWVHLDQAAVRRVGEYELGAHAPVGIDGGGERILIGVMSLEPGGFTGRQPQHVGVGGAAELDEGHAPIRRSPHHHRTVAQIEVGGRSLSATMRAAPTIAPTSVTENLFE